MKPKKAQSAAATFSPGSYELEAELREVWAARGFDIAYQPQVNLMTHQVAGFEALLRWRHPVRGDVPREDFIPLAARIGLLSEISEWVLAQACLQAVNWPEPLYVAVNASATQLRDTGFPGIVAAALEASGLPPSRLELELIETEILPNNLKDLAVLHSLHAIGIRLAVDDVGAGNATLCTLMHFAYDKIKLDRSFAEKLASTEERSNAVRIILRGIIGICKDLKIIFLAEGIETPEQLAILQEEHCLFGQGFLLSEPVAPAMIPALLKKINGEPAMPAPANDLLQGTQFGLPFYQIVETASDIIIVTTPQLDAPGPTIIYVNPAFTRLTGYTAAEAIGATPRMLQGPGTSRATLDAISSALREGRPVHEKVLNFAKCGAPYWLDLRIVALRDAAGMITHFAAIERDVTMDKRRADELEVIADRDTLTGIPNRRAFLRAIEAEMETAARHQGDKDAKGLCLALIDVDHFKKINDDFGHAVGDAVLFGIADRLTENIRRLDMLGRIGGEEFGVCMPGVSLKDAKALAEHLRYALADAPIPTLAGPVPVTVSIGVSSFQADDSLARLMGRADAAMYSAKRSGRDRVRSHNRQS